MNQARVNLTKKGKLRITLIPVEVILEITKVFEFGLIKHKEQDSWKTMVIKNQDDFYNAALRHIYANIMGEQFDKESKISHLAHAIVNLIFLLWLELQDKIIRRKK